jgi:hypothetical protein
MVSDVSDHRASPPSEPDAIAEDADELGEFLRLLNA